MDSHPRPNATILLDGVALAESDKQRLLPQAQTQTQPPIQPAHTQQATAPFDDAQSVHDDFNPIRQGEWELLHHVQQRAREMADKTLRRTREIADEASALCCTNVCEIAMRSTGASSWSPGPSRRRSTGRALGWRLRRGPGCDDPVHPDLEGRNDRRTARPARCGCIAAAQVAARIGAQTGRRRTWRKPIITSCLWGDGPSQGTTNGRSPRTSSTKV